MGNRVKPASRRHAWALLLATSALVAVVLSCGPADLPQGPRGDSGGALGLPGRPLATPMPVPPYVAPPKILAPPPLPSAAQESLIEQDLAREAALAVGQQPKRIIVRTVDLTLVVADVGDAIARTADAAARAGGWVVASTQKGPHAGAISIRVPAEKLDQVLERLRGMAVKVESEVSKSEDFTDEYVDSSARVKNLEATQAALNKLLERAEKVEDALKVQAELTRVQEGIERLHGRLEFLAQSAAFSLVRVELTLTPQVVAVKAGPDLTAREGDPLSFRATFPAPEGINDFTYTWDFGDGSEPVTGYRTAPVVDSAERTTATVYHPYWSRVGSPFIATMELVGTGDAGIIKGEDTVIVRVVEDVQIQVYAGDDLFLTEGQSVELVASFTQPQGLSSFQYRWDFGDGSPPATGTLEGTGATSQATAQHLYAYYRPQPFLVTFRVTATGEVGEVKAEDQVAVSVARRPPLFLGWDVDTTVRTAVLVLTSVGIAVGQVLVFGAVLSPLWGVALLVVWLVRRRLRRRVPRVVAPPTPPEPTSG